METGADKMRIKPGRIFLWITAFILIINVFGCSPEEEQNESTLPVTVEPGNDHQPIIEEPEPTVEEMIKVRIGEMSLEDKLGQLLMMGIEGAAATDEELKLISQGKIGGVILFQRNIVDSDQVNTLLKSLNDANSDNVLPLFIGIDEEGGRVTRLSGIFKNLPSVSVLGDLDDQELSYFYGYTQALKLKTLGINLNFSPVLDVNSNPSNPVIGDRAISRDPEISARNGNSIIRGMSEAGIIPVGKHFPGHGDTSVDSHSALPRIEKDIEELFGFEFIPFIETINGGLPAIMVGHLLIEAVDDLPATLSVNTISELLRGQLGFNGVVFSDDMTMGAITDNHTIDEAVVEFIKAGGDTALVCHGVEPVQKSIQRLDLSIQEGSISEERIDESILRIMLLKNYYLENVENKSVPRESEVTTLIDELLIKMGE